MPSFNQRLYSARYFLGACFACGFSIALWDPAPRFVLTVALGLTAGVLFLGPYAAAVLYALRLGRFFGGHLRWPICLLLTLSAVALLDHLLHWSKPQFWMAATTALLGTTIGHDATLAVLQLRTNPRLDRLMVAFFPFFIGLAVLAGYSSLGFFSGLYQLASGLIN